MEESYKNDKVKSPDGINSSDKELLIELYSQFNKKNKKREKAGKSKISGEQYFEKLINKHDWKKAKKSMTIIYGGFTAVVIVLGCIFGKMSVSDKIIYAICIMACELVVAKINYKIYRPICRSIEKMKQDMEAKNMDYISYMESL